MARAATRLLVKQETTAFPLLELQGISAYDSTRSGVVQALSNVSLYVNRGEIVSLLGGKTSGKSTMMQVILGALHPLAGEVLLDGKPITLLSPTEILRRGISAASNIQQTFPNLTIEENLGLGAYIRRGRAAVREDMQRVFAVFPRLADRRYQRAGTLTGGELQMLTLARALISRPRLICIEEPTKGLAPACIDQVLDKIVEMNGLGVTIFMVEQNAELALSIATRAYVLQGDTLALQGTANDLLNSPISRQVYLGQTA